MVLGITSEDLRDILEVRLRLEGLAAARTAERITEEQLGQLRETMDLQEFYLSKRDADHILSLIHISMRVKISRMNLFSPPFACRMQRFRRGTA